MLHYQRPFVENGAAWGEIAAGGEIAGRGTEEEERWQNPGSPGFQETKTS